MPPLGRPPTPEEVEALARKEHVPARIAKGELEGKMKARVWRKLHPEEARRFDQVYELMGKHPNLSLADAFGVIQSGLSVDDFLARRARAQKKTQVKEARKEVPSAAIDEWIEKLVRDKVELSLVLGEKTIHDVIVKVEPVSFHLEKAGRLEKLQVVALCPRAVWDGRAPKLPRDEKLAQKPLPVARQPEKRPVADPRPFLEHVGKRLQLLLRNGIQLDDKLIAVGPFDLLVGEAGAETFVPLHALVKWSAA